MIQRRVRQPSAGFTMIELMLAMAFVAALLIAVATTVIQMSSTYTRGLVLNEINKASRTVTTALTTDIQNAQPGNLADVSHYVKTMAGGTQVGGRLCLGNYSYIWNTAAAWQSNGTLTTGANVYNSVSAPAIYLVKVPDVGGVYCSSPTKAITWSNDSSQDGADLIDDTSHDLMLQSLTIASAVTDASANESLYTISFVLSSNDTADDNADIVVPSHPGDIWQCAPPADFGANFDFTRCSVQQFSIAVRVGNGDNS